MERMTCTLLINGSLGFLKLVFFYLKLELKHFFSPNIMTFFSDAMLKSNSSN